MIRALNADLPFDQFTIHQIAGDLLPGASVDQKVATGFHRNTMINEQGGIDVEEFRFASLVDRVATTGAVWLGVTVRCAQCHTHKYDPITQRDYYRFFAFLDNADEPDLPIPELAIAARRAPIEAKIRDLESRLADRFLADDPTPSWSVLAPRRVVAKPGSPLTILADGSILAGGDGPAVDSHEVESEVDPAALAGLRIEALTDPTLPRRGPGRAPNGNFVLGEVSATLESGEPRETIPLKLASASADVAQPGFAIDSALDGNVGTGWAVDAGPATLNRDHAATFAIAASRPLSGPARLVLKLDQGYGGQHTLGRFRISASRPPGATSGSIEGRRAARLDRKAADWERSLRPRRWEIQAPVAVTSANGATLRLLADRSILAAGNKPNRDIYRVEIPVGGRPITAIRLEVLPDPSLPDGGPGRAPPFSVGNFLLSEVEARVIPGDGGPARPVALVQASADYQEAGRDAGLAIDGRADTGWSVGGAIGRPHAIVFRPAAPIEADQAGRLALTLNQTYIHQMTIGRFRVSTTADPGPPAASDLPAEVEAAATVEPARRSPEDSSRLRGHFPAITPELAPARAEIAALRRSLPAQPTSMVMEERPLSEARTTRIRRRGEFLQATEVVTPAVPPVLSPLPTGAKPDRLALARWLVAEDNPLVGRVVMNRAWQAFFGRGIVSTIEDFGVRGAKPTHPELLDWLATELIRSAWSMKAMHRLIATSATYRQASKAAPGAVAADPLNQRLGRGARFRIDAEMIRDGALRAAGLLDDRLGGPSVYPPQPDGVTSLSYGQSGWPTSTGADRYRRGLYTYTKRTAPFAATATFDAPTPEVACVRRERSNTPLQALTLLNDPGLLEAARAMGRRIVLEGPADAVGRADFAYRLALGRRPTAEEVALLIRFRDGQISRVQAGELDPGAINGAGPNSRDPELAAWSIAARAVLNLDETITKE